MFGKKVKNTDDSFPPRRFDSFPAQAGSPPADGGAVGIKYRQPGSADGSEEGQGGDSCKLLIAVCHRLTHGDRRPLRHRRSKSPVPSSPLPTSCK